MIESQPRRVDGRAAAAPYLARTAPTAAASRPSTRFVSRFSGIVARGVARGVGATVRVLTETAEFEVYARTYNSLSTHKVEAQALQEMSLVVGLFRSDSLCAGFALSTRRPLRVLETVPVREMRIVEEDQAVLLDRAIEFSCLFVDRSRLPPTRRLLAGLVASATYACAGLFAYRLGPSRKMVFDAVEPRVAKAYLTYLRRPRILYRGPSPYPGVNEVTLFACSRARVLFGSCVSAVLAFSILRQARVRQAGVAGEVRGLEQGREKR